MVKGMEYVNTFYLMLCSILHVLSVRELHDRAIIMSLSSWQSVLLYIQYRCILWFFTLLASPLYNFVINLNVILWEICSICLRFCVERYKRKNWLLIHLFNNLFSLYRISYSVYELKRLKSLNESTRSRVIIMYDIACLLAHHWKVSKFFEHGCVGG